ALGDAEGLPRGPHRLRVADPQVRGPRGRRVRLLRGPVRGPGGGGALRRRGGETLPPRGGLLLRDVPEGVRPRRPRALGGRGDRPRRRPDGREVRPPGVRGAGCHRPGHAARPPRRPRPARPHRRPLRRPIRLPEAGGAL
ncbi:MAG: hypothetical protein AVDCRST_MAG25-3723, partial [uncultured Rubrobacteraceae bacterium]